MVNPILVLSSIPKADQLLDHLQLFLPTPMRPEAQDISGWKGGMWWKEEKKKVGWKCYRIDVC